MKHLIIMVACMLGICSCDHKELCMNHSHMVDVDVVFDWSHAPDADPATGANSLRPVRERPDAV